MKVTVIDYGLSNLLSVQHAFAHFGAEVQVTSSPADVLAADALVLPGVGAFQDGMAGLQKLGLVEPIRQKAAAGTPLLGICLGMQLLFETSFEYGEHQGLGLISGQVRDIGTVLPSGLAIPHMGWNALHFPGERPRSPIFRALEEGTHVYFVHSFAGFDCKGQCTATTEYGAELTAAVQNGNVYGTQFHPEKSGAVGLTILKAFCELE